MPPRKPLHGERKHTCLKSASEIKLLAVNNIGQCNDVNTFAGDFSVLKCGKGERIEIRLSRIKTDILIEVLDQMDIFYLQTTRITPEDFKEMSQEQGITAPFELFFDLIKEMLLNSKEVENPMYLTFTPINDQLTVLSFKDRSCLGLQDVTRLNLRLSQGSHFMVRGQVEKKIASLEAQLKILSMEYDQARINICREEERLRQILKKKERDDEQMLIERQQQQYMFENIQTKLKASYDEIFRANSVKYQEELNSIVKNKRDEHLVTLSKLEEANTMLGEERQSKEQLYNQNQMLRFENKRLEECVEELNTTNKVLRGKIMNNDESCAVSHGELLASLKQCTDLLRTKDQEIAVLKENHSRMIMEVIISGRELDAVKKQMEKMIQDDLNNNEEVSELLTEINEYRMFLKKIAIHSSKVEENVKLFATSNQQIMKRLKTLEKKAQDFETNKKVLMGTISDYVKIINNLQCTIDRSKEEELKKKIENDTKTNIEDYYWQKFKPVKLVPNQTALQTVDIVSLNSLGNPSEALRSCGIRLVNSNAHPPHRHGNPQPDFQPSNAVPSEGAVGGFLEEGVQNLHLRDSHKTFNDSDFPPLPEVPSNPRLRNGNKRRGKK